MSAEPTRLVTSPGSAGRGGVTVGVRARILATVGVLAIVTLVLTIFSSTKLASFKGSEQELFDDGVKPVVELYSLQRHFQSVRARVMLYPAADAEMRADLKTQIAEFHAEELAAIDGYRPVAADPKTFADYEAKYAALYKAMVEEAIPAAETGNITTFRAVYKDKIKGPLSDLLDTLQAVADAQAKMAADKAADDKKAADRTIWTLWLLLAIGLALTITLALVFAAKIVRPLLKVRDSLIAMADGDLTHPVDHRSNDEVGQMAEALRKAQSSVRTVISQIHDSTRTMTTQSTQLDQVAEELGDSAGSTSGMAGAVAESAGQMASLVQAMSAATEEMSASIGEIAHQATSASEVASEAVKAAGATSEAVAELDVSSNEIGEIVRTITSIAEQTNLLALNATIEAARAGEAGKGFAVVATEVKDLAQGTAKATDDITAKIQAIQSTTSRAIEAIARISGIIDQIHEKQTTIAAAVEEQSATTNEISRTVSDVSGQSESIAENIQGIASSAAQTTEGVQVTATSAAELTTLAREMDQMVAHFRV